MLGFPHYHHVRPPQGRVCINEDSPQSVGLEFWMPCLPMNGDQIELRQNRTMTRVATPTVNPDQSKGIVLAFNGTSQYFWMNSAAIAAEPLSMSCWWNPDNVTADDVVMSLGDGGAAFGFWGINFRGSSAADLVTAQKRDDAGAANALADSATSYVANAWHHAAGIFESDTSRTAALNGVKGTANTTSVADPTPDFTTIAALKRSTVTSWAGGLGLDFRIYSRALTDADLALMNDPRTMYDLWYPLGRTTWSFPKSIAAAVTAYPWHYYQQQMGG